MTAPNWEAASASGQAAQALHVLDATFGAAASLAFLSHLLPQDSYSSADESAMLTAAQVTCYRFFHVVVEHATLSKKVYNVLLGIIHAIL